jgi:hypothetical protein
MVGKDRNCSMIKPNMTFIVGGALTSVKEITGKKHQQSIDSDAILYVKDETWRNAKESVVVKCHPLSSLMNTLGQAHIDYISLDVEGEEMIILQSIDWKHFDIDVFTIETDQHQQDILTFMKTHGYKWIQTISDDDVFCKIK